MKNGGVNQLRKPTYPLVSPSTLPFHETSRSPMRLVGCMCSPVNGFSLYSPPSRSHVTWRIMWGIVFPNFFHYVDELSRSVGQMLLSLGSISNLNNSKSFLAVVLFNLHWRLIGPLVRLIICRKHDLAPMENKWYIFFKIKLSSISSVPNTRRDNNKFLQLTFRNELHWCIHKVGLEGRILR